MPINSFLYPGAKVTTGYDVDNSLRFDDGSSDYLNRTPSTTTNRKTFTFSTWVKKASNGTQRNIFGTAGGNDNGWLQLGFSNADVIFIQQYSGNLLVTNAVYRDPSAWYHIVMAFDNTQATASNRIKLYVNGNQVTSFSTETYQAQNFETGINLNTEVHYIGREGGNYFDGYMAEVVLVDGQQLDATSFGEFDEDSGIWKPIDISGLTFGTNGFYLDFEDSAALGDDVSGNGNDFTVNNLTAIDQSTDTCTNNFCTLNPLDVTADDEATLSEGNLKAVADGAFHQTRSTFYLTTGKWFWEFKATSVGDALQGGVVGSNYAGGSGLRRNYQHSAAKYTDGSSSSYGATFTDGDIIGVALDLDNGTLIFYKNGVSQGTAYTDMLSAIGQDGWTPDVIIYNSTVELNFGNPPFSISSGNTDGNGYGNFEYAPPSGYLSLCTKNLSEYG
jgi:hypothetical protein